MQLQQIRIVMVNPSHSGNIGAAARAMKNMGLQQLCLVAPKQFPDQVALTRASGADDILEQALVVDTLPEALHGVQVVYGTSARLRHLEWPLVDVRECAQKIAATNATVAIVFGRENSGLTNEELALCHYHLHIPTVAEFSSLNLSQAIQVVAYELRMTALQHGAVQVAQPVEQEELASVENTEGFYHHLESTLSDIEYLNKEQPKMLMMRLRRLFLRTELKTTEVHILRGILSKVQQLAEAKRNSATGI